MKVRLFALLGLFAVAAIQPAGAADLPPPYLPKSPPPVPVYNWTGFYVGANGGGGTATRNFSGTQTTPFGPASFSGNNGIGGAIAGGTVGFNYEFPTRIVIGVEADYDWSNYTGQSVPGGAAGCATFTGGAFAGLPSGCATDTTTLNDIGTARGRVGYAWENVLFYGTGGFAWSKFSSTTAASCLGVGCPASAPGILVSGGTSSFSTSPTGWVAGGGVEWGVAPNVTIKLEYLFADFANVGATYTTTAVTTLGTGTTTTHVTSNSGVSLFRIGVNYLFNFF